MNIGSSVVSGNEGECLAQYLLSRYCLVRPVVGNTDIGVDLYCEALFEGEPFVHFWVQVKRYRTIANKRVRQGQAFDFETKHLNYWMKQPVPVIALLVPSTDEVRYIHVVDIHQRLMEHGISRGEKQRLWSYPDLILPVCERRALARSMTSLLYSHIPWAISNLYASKGIAMPAPRRGNKGPEYYAIGFTTKYAKEITKRTESVLGFYVSQSCSEGKRPSRLLVRLLRVFAQPGSFLTQYALGQFESRAGHRSAALALDRGAIGSVPAGTQYAPVRREIRQAMRDLPTI